MSLTRRELFERCAALALVRPDGPQPVDTRRLEDAARRAAAVIRGYSAEGFHRTATAVDRASADRIVALARSDGAAARLEPFDLSRVDPVDAFLEIDRRRIEGLPMFDASATDRNGTAGAIGPIAGHGSDRPIALTKVAPNADVELRKVREASRHRAIVAVTTGQRPGLCPVNATDFTQPFGPPVLQVGSEHMAAIEQAVQSCARVRVVAHSTRKAATAFNVAAEFQGTHPELKPVCVMTPRSGWYRNASERGGGLASWLEALRAVAATKPRRTVRFVASSGHELGHLGLHSYLDRNASLASGALIWVHLGANIGASTGPTAMTCSDDRAEAAALRALGAYGIDDLPRSPAAQVGGEALTISRKGGRFISFIGRNAWFHNSRDTWPDAVDPQAVARFALAVSDLTLALADTAAD
jgi:hypothetical protein